jgi:hypothetical protein
MKTYFSNRVLLGYDSGLHGIHFSKGTFNLNTEEVPLQYQDLKRISWCGMVEGSS